MQRFVLRDGDIHSGVQREGGHDMTEEVGDDQWLMAGMQGPGGSVKSAAYHKGPGGAAEGPGRCTA